MIVLIFQPDKAARENPGCKCAPIHGSNSPAIESRFRTRFMVLGPKQIDLGLGRRFNISERHSITLVAQAFNVLNHANYYVQNGTGVNQIQYEPIGSTCGDGKSANQQCYLVPQQAFGSLLVINALNGPRTLQFAMKWNF